MSKSPEPLWRYDVRRPKERNINMRQIQNPDVRPILDRAQITLQLTFIILKQLQNKDEIWL